MPMLICQPVSHRSSPGKIRQWISQLEELRGRHRNDPEAVKNIDRFLSKARGWVQPGREGAEMPAGRHMFQT